MRSRQTLNRLRVLVVLITLLINLKVSQSQGRNIEIGWIRVCDHNSKNFRSSGLLHVQSDQCPHGTWLSQPITAPCVCLNGLWAIGRKWCDEDYLLFFGRGHCFSLQSETQRLAFLGHSNDSFAPLNLLTKKNGHVFKEFNDFTSMPYEYDLEYKDSNLNKTIIQLLPTNDEATEKGKYLLLELSEMAHPSMFSPSYSVSRSTVCVEIQGESLLHSSEESVFPVVHVTKIREAIRNLRIVDRCPDGVVIYKSAEYSHKISMQKIRLGQGVHVKSGKMQNHVNTCESCTSSPITHRIRRATSINKHSSGTPNALVSAPEYLISPGASNPEDKQRLVNEETLRVIRTELLFLLDREKPPKQYNLNWQLLQRAKEAFIKVCPDMEAPKFLVNSLFRLFRFLYIHSKDANPYSHFFEEGPQSVRIADALDSCIKDASPLEFEFKLEKLTETCAPKEITVDAYIEDPATNTSIVNGTTTTTQIYCQCMDKVNVVNMNYTKNVSNPNELFNLTKEEFLLPPEYTYSLIPPSEKFNGSFHDFPVETAWKIVSFAHYYCAKYFKDRPADHSAMLMKFESLFNTDIVHRWVHPGARTNETWQNLYNAFNLQKFADAVDICVASAKRVSDYPEWISRPTLERLSRRKRSLNTHPLRNGQSSFCLEDPMDPVHKLGVDASDQCYEWNRVD